MTQHLTDGLIERDPSADNEAFAELPVVPFEDATPTPSAASAAAALLLGFTFLMVGNGLQGSLIGVRAEIESFATVWTGLIMTGYFAGFLLGTKMAARSLAEVGHVRVFAALASLVSVASLVHALAVLPPVWVLMRFLTGVCMAGIYVTTESWLNDIATNRTRGRLLAAYMVASMGGLGAGQFLLTTADPESLTLFIVASIMVSTALVPVSLSTSGAPPIADIEPMNIRSLVKIAPTGVVVMFLVGVSAGALLGMGAVYASREGLDTTGVAVFMGAAIAGSIVFQFPVGYLSDRLPRRGLMFALAASAVAICIAMIGIAPGTVASTAGMFLLGGCMFPLYSLAIAYTNDWIHRSQILGASSTLVRVNGLGAVAGPLVTAAVFTQVSSRWFFAVIAVAHALMAAYVGFRILVKDALPVEKQRKWVPLASRGSYLIAGVARQRRSR